MLQMGFDLDYVDGTTGMKVPFDDFSDDLVNKIHHARWKVVDLETSGLNDTDSEQNFSGKDLRRGVDATLRVRVASILWQEADGTIVVNAFDLDKLTFSQRCKVSVAYMTGAVFGHNVGFDAYWLSTMYDGQKVQTKYLLDSMLISRALFPEQPLRLAAISADENEDPEFQQHAFNTLLQGKSGWALADLTAVLLRKIMDKGFQGPKNWCEPFLTQRHYDYATGDVKDTYELLCTLFNIPVGSDLLEAYERIRAENSVIRMLEPQVLDVVAMRIKGMPWDVDAADKYVEQQKHKVVTLVNRLIEIEPALGKFKLNLIDLGEGIKADLKQVLGEAFSSRGLSLETTEKTGAFKIGEKDLRKAKAQITEQASELFDVWVGICKAKKTASMARDVSGFAKRSKDGRLHPNTGHGPVTGRLSSSIPNCQQFPKDQQFRDCVAAPPGKKILAVDYSALDMRVGAALAVRAQRRIFDAYMSGEGAPPDVLEAIARVIEGQISVEQAQGVEKAAVIALEHWMGVKKYLEDVISLSELKEKFTGYQDWYWAKLIKEARGNRDEYPRSFWNGYRKRKRAALLARFTRCYAYVRMRAEQAGTDDWSSLRDAFSIEGMDIHTWTALSMTGQDPIAMFAGKPAEEVGPLLKAAKKELGDIRQTGKVGNLSLLYAMGTLGLMDAASRIYNIHWTYEEADAVRKGWLASYVEIDLWHAWTELTPHGRVMVPDLDRGGKVVNKDVYESSTLGNRKIYAFSLNAALSYDDQSSGADILGTVMNRLRNEYPEVFDTIVNQVHDEVVFEIPADHADEYTEIAHRVMVESAEQFLMPYGVKGECGAVVGDVWLKD